MAVAFGALPILIHLMNRRRHPRVPWAAMRFLLAAHRRSARRIRLEQLGLLALRIAIVILFGWAVARPILSRTPLGMLGQTRAHHILLIDNSCSMAAENGDAESRFAEALRFAGELVSALPTGDAISVITLASPATPVVGHAAYDRRQIRDTLAEVQLTQRSTDTAGGLSAAIRVLEESEIPAGNHVVYIISDAPALDWTVASPLVGDETPGSPPTRGDATSTTPSPTRGDAMPGGQTGVFESAGRFLIPTSIGTARILADQAELIFVNVGSNDASNLAISDLRVRHGASVVAGDQLLVPVTLSVANHSDATVRGRTIQVALDGAIVRTLPIGTIDARARTEVTFSVMIDQPGPHMLSAAIDALEDDALRVDNQRWLAIEATSALPVLLVDGRPGSTPLSGQAGFLATALAPNATPLIPRLPRGDQGGLRSGQAFFCRTISHRDFAAEPLTDYAVVALCNVQRLSPTEWQRLTEFVGDGGGLLVFAGDLVQADNYNRYGHADGTGVLPARIDRVVGDLESPQIFVRFAPDSFIHPAMVDFADQTDSGLFRARVNRYLAVEPDETRANVVLRYIGATTQGAKEGPPAIVEQPFGRGRVCFVTTSPDMAWTNLPAKGDYVSLMVNLATHLHRRDQTTRNLLVGDLFEENLQPAEISAPLWITLPDGNAADARLNADSGRFSLQFGPVERAGAYAASAGPRIVSFAANIDPRESDLRIADAGALRKILNVEFRMVAAKEGASALTAEAASNEFAMPLLVLVLFFLFAESFFATR
ncbi:MAG: VWA domain-containing protein, partial [Planctomycetes bacterium]|nr:VWA domain-containing protein [Planctomycetota bacterium]